MDLYESRNAIEFKKAVKNFYDNTFTSGSGGGIIKDEDSEGWITINGTHVHLDSDGNIDMGPAGLTDGPGSDSGDSGSSDSGSDSAGDSSSSSDIKSEVGIYGLSIDSLDVPDKEKLVSIWQEDGYTRDEMIRMLMAIEDGDTVDSAMQELDAGTLRY